MMSSKFDSVLNNNFGCNSHTEQETSHNQHLDIWRGYQESQPRGVNMPKAEYDDLQRATIVKRVFCWR